MNTCSPSHFFGARPSLRGLIAAFLLCAVVVFSAGAQTADPLVHMGVLYLSDDKVATTFAERLAAHGKPMFYVGNVSKGISQGDIVRFKDKAVLIDGDVWQTMLSMGILNSLKNMPLMTLSAKAHSEVWRGRSSMVSKSNENKGYILGSELLKIFEDYFGKTPSNLEMVVAFDGEYMSLVAPRQLLSEMNFAQVLRVQKTADKLSFIPRDTIEKVFAAQSFDMSVWAIDPAEPSGQIQYTCASDLPPGISFNALRHTLEGSTDSVGSWPLLFSARNSRGQSASLACTLLVIRNTAPRVLAQCDDPLISGSLWTYRPFVADREQGVDEVQVELSTAPAGMQFDPKTSSLEWLVPSGIEDSLVSCTITARDPLGASSQALLSLHIISALRAQQTVTMDFRLPLDTLVQGHAYAWADHLWMKAEWKKRSVRLASVMGGDSTAYLPASDVAEGRLFIRPRTSGEHTVTFIFAVDTSRIVVQKRFVVAPNAAPAFVSALSACRFAHGQFAEYVPAVRDADGDSLRLSVVDASGAEVPLVDAHLRLSTDSSGMATAMLVARDPFGNTARQQLVWTVDPEPRTEPAHAVSVYAQKTYRRNVDIGIRGGGLRIGLYFDEPGKSLKSGVLGLNTYESPFVYFGANPLTRQAEMGNYFFVDGGISARMYGKRIFAGGLLGRIQTDYCRDGTADWRFMAFFMVRYKQGYLVMDTTGISSELTFGADNPLAIFDSSAQKYLADLKRVFGDYGAEDNVGLNLSLQTLYRLPAGFWAGPAAWIEDDFRHGQVSDTVGDSLVARNESIGNILKPFVGPCLMHEWRHRGFYYSQQLKLGWAGDGWTPRLAWQFLVQGSFEWGGGAAHVRVKKQARSVEPSRQAAAIKRQGVQEPLTQLNTSRVAPN